VTRGLRIELSRQGNAVLLDKIRAAFAVKQLVDDIKEVHVTSQEKEMSLVVKNFIVWALTELVKHEPAIEPHIKNETEKKILADAVAAVKALLPVISGL
jgi:hypothetical protein